MLYLDVVEGSALCGEVHVAVYISDLCCVMYGHIPLRNASFALLLAKPANEKAAAMSISREWKDLSLWAHLPGHLHMRRRKP